MLRSILVSGLLLGGAGCCAIAEEDNPQAVLERLLEEGVGSDRSCADVDRWAQTLPRAEDDATQRLFIGIDGYRNACSIDASDLTSAEAEKVLGDEPLAIELADDRLTLFARHTGEGSPQILGTLSNADWRVLSEAGDIWGARLRLTDADRALITLLLLDPETYELSDQIEARGPNAPAAPLFMDDPDTDTVGTITETWLLSPELGENRKLHIYLPPDHEPDGTTSVLVLADGGSVPFYARMVEPMIAAGLIRPLALIGIASGRGAIENVPQELASYDIRSLDYLPGYQASRAPETQDAFPDRFERHMAFVTQTLLPWARETYGLSESRDDASVSGQSSGGVFALHAGYRHPDVFASAIPVSPGWLPSALAEPAPAEPKAATFFLAAGLYEPYFLKSAQISAEGLTNAGYSVVTSWNAAGHAPDQTEAMLFHYLPRAFPPRTE